MNILFKKGQMYVYVYIVVAKLQEFMDLFDLIESISFYRNVYNYSYKIIRYRKYFIYSILYMKSIIESNFLSKKEKVFFNIMTLYIVSLIINY